MVWPSAKSNISHFGNQQTLAVLLRLLAHACADVSDLVPLQRCPDKAKNSRRCVSHSKLACALSVWKHHELERFDCWWYPLAYTATVVRWWTNTAALTLRCLSQKPWKESNMTILLEFSIGHTQSLFHSWSCRMTWSLNAVSTDMFEEHSEGYDFNQRSVTSPAGVMTWIPKRLCNKIIPT